MKYLITYEVNADSPEDLTALITELENETGMIPVEIKPVEE